MTTPSPSSTEHFDAIVVGAGFGGMYMLQRLRRAGFTVRVIEAAGDVGGTWYWNRYPGCQCDVASMEYSYSFDEDLQQDWNWSHRYAPQPEILDYARHVADRFDLRRDIVFETRVTRATFDEAEDRWTIQTDTGQRLTARFFITAVGCLSTANMPDFEGQADFRGQIYHTGHWPHEEVDFSGKRVAVIGTGSSGVQSIPYIARQAAELHVFQRTPNFVVPAQNRPLDPAERDAIKQDYAGLRARARTRPTGFTFQYNRFGALSVDAEERERHFEEYWQIGGLPFLGVFKDLLLDRDANKAAGDFVNRKIRAIVQDPVTADLLCPDDIIGCKRLVADNGYFETYNSPHVHLVDISKTPITRLTPNGLMVGETEYPVDAIVCATGFDAITGSYLKIDIRGVGGCQLRDKWADGPRTYLGLGINGFPNMFMMTGPNSPSVFVNLILGNEQQGDWIAECLEHMRASGQTRIEAERGAEDIWVDHVGEVAGQSLRAQCNSWYLGANIPGKPRVFIPYAGGFPAYDKKLKEVAGQGYEGFVLSG